MRGKITRFFGDTFYLSNFYGIEITYKGITYPSVEHAYQASKTRNRREKIRISNLKYPGDAKRAGTELKKRGLQRDDWSEVNIKIMEILLRKKFSKQHISNVWRRLLNTGDKKLIEGNPWGDRFWGMATVGHGKLRGKNHLGKLLMKIRKDLR